MHLRQSRFTYNDCGIFIKKKKKEKSLKNLEIHHISIKMTR